MAADETGCAPDPAAAPGAGSSRAVGLDQATVRQLLAQARRLSRRQADVDDLVQEVLLAAWQAGRFDLPWLSGVLARQAALQARTALRRRRRETDAVVDETVATIDPLQCMSSTPARPAWLQRLPPSSRRVAILALHGLAAEEIRWLLGITPVAFRQRLTVIRKALAALGAPARGEGLALARIRDPARSVDLQYGLVRRSLRLAMRGQGVGTHDGDGHLLVIHGRAHVPAFRGNG